MNIATLTPGTKVYTVGFYGESGTKSHLFCGTVAPMKDGSNGIISAPFSCDGTYMNGAAGTLRGMGGAICTADDAEKIAKIDAAITCEDCRKAMGLCTVAESIAASAALAAKKAEADAPKIAAKAAREAAALAKDIRAARADVKSAKADLAWYRKNGVNVALPGETKEVATARVLGNVEYRVTRAEEVLAALLAK